MKTYMFAVNATISLSIEVKADTLEDAVKAAQAAGIRSLCWQCNGAPDGEWGTEEDCGHPSECELVHAMCDGEDLQASEVPW